MGFMLAIAILVTAPPTGASYSPRMGMICSAPRDIGGGQTVKTCELVRR